MVVSVMHGWGNVGLVSLGRFSKYIRRSGELFPEVTLLLSLIAVLRNGGHSDARLGQ